MLTRTESNGALTFSENGSAVGVGSGVGVEKTDSPVKLAASLSLNGLDGSQGRRLEFGTSMEDVHKPNNSNKSNPSIGSPPRATLATSRQLNQSISMPIPKHTTLSGVLSSHSVMEPSQNIGVPVRRTYGKNRQPVLIAPPPTETKDRNVKDEMNEIVDVIDGGRLDEMDEVGSLGNDMARPSLVIKESYSVLRKRFAVDEEESDGEGRDSQDSAVSACRRHPAIFDPIRLIALSSIRLQTNRFEEEI